MFFDNEQSPVFRPPSEAYSFILRVTVGCSHNKCTYCNMYRSVNFHVKSRESVTEQIKAAAATGFPVKRVFLADGDALILSTDKLLAILKELYATFPKLQRVSSYAGPKSILSKSLEDLKLLREAGLKLLYYGMETGSDNLLGEIKKGVNAKEAVAAGVRVKKAGMKLSMMVILGLAGKDGTKEHAYATAKAINEIKPDMLSALTLMLYRGSELKERYEKGDFTVLTPAELMQELYDIVNNIDLPIGNNCIFRSNHVSNYLPLAGILSKDKVKLLQNIQNAVCELEKIDYYDPYNAVERY